ncbi:conserved hypothetical protein [Bathymodiolus platifrons methanotrophic gill symbiont]|uniref:hypothetical protein n=1 Tax=Bathymodiolus platifrons methanotrophic gill symbiont TaxID=113268 RepID=UPI000B41C4B4|nr:hypothetical protein [Bathymodiolus platifrons methanotrophic gill symbiont]MCK5870171.1 hypothetical protein [Methyloprofundus sp.]TXK99453.1 hypothetical protein BMR10_00185 [Methylococcaceae bacterium CS4]TXL00783.1 hypothetical protein BMR11_01810 [Methylococcaceae bacterium CS5]TXL08845.1 hypothetical protein BMR07_01590 [Methylococcaceae bacterium CS1]TXL08991.1 hypothetical protein BMR09_01900 [Methylococcaceae bacterium CS3]TXL10999.1 hypothetical protein BMR08_06190 [Methylococcac
MNYALIGTLMLFVATLGGWLIVRFKDTNKSKQVKWALFVLYFWLLNFIQLIMLAVAHYLMR